MIEYGLLSLIAVLPGIPLAIGLRWLIGATASSDTVSIPMFIEPIHYAVSGGICLIVSLFANLLSIRSISRMEMIDALKERE